MRKISFAYWQLFVLMLLHFTADMIGGMLPGILPVLREYFGMSMAAGVMFLAICGLSSNFCQISVGALRKNSEKPFFIYVGLFLLLFIGIFGFLPRSTPHWLLMVLSIVFGCGTAVVHPEGLRGAMALKDVNSTTATALFMTTGFFGFSCGPLVGALLIDGPHGLKGLIAAALFVLCLMAAFFMAKITLLTDKSGKSGDEKKDKPDYCWSFSILFLIAFFMNTGSAILQGLLPSFLHDVNGFSLKTGGFAALLFGLGSAIGSIVNGILSKRFRPSLLTIVNLLAGVCLTLLYLLLNKHLIAVMILFFAGFTVSSSLPLLVVMARFVPAKIGIGMKMGLMVGGTWGCAGVVMLFLSMWVEKIGIGNAVNFSGAFYVAALLTAVISVCFFRCRQQIEKGE